MKSIKEKSVKIISVLSDNTSNKIKLKFAKFNHIVEKEYKEKMKLIDDDISGKIKIYGKNEDKCNELKNGLIEGYDNNFQKLYDKRKEQILGIILEITELESNREVTVANLFNSIDMSSKTKVKDDKAKTNALVDKLNCYTVAIDQAFSEIDLVCDAIVEDFSVVVSRIETSVTDTKKSSFIDTIKKLLASFNKKGKFEKSISNEISNDIVDIGNAEEEMMISIYNQTMEIISQIEKLRKNINDEYRKAIG